MKAAYLLFISFLFAFGISSCKKTDKTDPEPDQPQNNQPAQGFGNCYGEINFTENTNMQSPNPSVTRWPIVARFYNLPIINNQKTDLNVGQVSVNGTVLKRFGGFTTHASYSDTTNQLYFLPAFTLVASGADPSSGFELKYSGGTPMFGDTSAIPKVVSRSAGINITFKNMLNCDSLKLTFSRDFEKQIVKAAAVNSFGEATIMVSSNEINLIMENNVDASITVSVFRRVFLRFGTRDYMVYSNKNYTRPVMVSFF